MVVDTYKSRGQAFFTAVAVTPLGLHSLCVYKTLGD